MAIRKIWLISCLDLDVINGGGGVFGGQSFQRKQAPTEFFVDERSAKQAAESIARENPMKPYGIFAVDSVVETGNAPVVTKKYTSEGELLPV
jgi:hypothetical protein